MDQPSTSHWEALAFACKAAVCAVLAVVVFDLFDLPGAIWAAVSAVIVTQPSLHPSIKASLTRVIANLIGALIGAALSTILGHTLLALALGVALAGLICHFARLDDAARPAFAAVVIVIFATEKRAWAGSLDRVLAVLIGCLCALAVGFVFDKASNGFGFRRKHSPPNNQPGE